MIEMDDIIINRTFMCKEEKRKKKISSRLTKRILLFISGYFVVILER